ncbi:hypothetical protein FE257_004730 [Aspergillus nanangensis]|uniref:SRR1-like domain-containing protein n=1 Tax=Aspergillus nanangensis TaxID=2582783 RepID=A0AAD4CR44_ASPNN|nr:hypothetical protein FE257_004730 [Aspergillus nanangensis]
MPHTHRKKSLPAHKRLQVTDSSGWTHVTSGGKSAHRVLRQNQTSPHLVPAEPPSQLTLSDLQTQFQTYKHRWDESPLAQTVQTTLCAYHCDQIVCIGLGSPSGFLRGGWVDRRNVSMYQLAALVGVMDAMAKEGESDEQSPRPEVYAQDPVFNTLDEALLASLGITVLQHPHAFDMVSSKALLFCPGAERAHLEQVLPSQPAILFGGPLEEVESDVVSRYVQSKRAVRLPRFEAQEHAFWNMRVYVPADESVE